MERHNVVEMYNGFPCTNTRRVPLILTLGRKFNSSLRVARWRFFTLPSIFVRVLKTLSFRRTWRGEARRGAARRGDRGRAKSMSTTRLRLRSTPDDDSLTQASTHFPSRAFY